MRKLLTILPLIILLLPSCYVLYEQVDLKKTYENNIVTIKEVVQKNNGRKCISKEITTKRDTISNQMTFKEVVTYDCKGAWSQVIKRKTWTWNNDEKTVIVSNN